MGKWRVASDEQSKPAPFTENVKDAAPASTARTWDRAGGGQVTQARNGRAPLA